MHDIYIYIHISGNCLRCMDLFHCFFCTARHCTWQAENPNCMELHVPAGNAPMHGFARKMCKYIPKFTDLHGTAWKVPSYMDPNLALLMELNLARRCPWQAQSPLCADLRGPPLARICLD